MKVFNDDENRETVVYFSEEDKKRLTCGIKKAIEELSIVVRTAEGREVITDTDGEYSQEALNMIFEMFNWTL